MITLGLVLVAIAFFLSLTGKTGQLPLVFNIIGYALVLYFGLKLLLAPHGILLP